MKRILAALTLLTLALLLTACAAPAEPDAPAAVSGKVALSTARRTYLLDPTYQESATRILVQGLISNDTDQPLGPLSAVTRFEVHVGGDVHVLTPEFLQPVEGGESRPLSAKAILQPGETVEVQLLAFLQLDEQDRQTDAELIIVVDGETLRWILPATE